MEYTVILMRYVTVDGRLVWEPVKSEIFEEISDANAHFDLWKPELKRNETLAIVDFDLDDPANEGRPAIRFLEYV